MMIPDIISELTRGLKLDFLDSFNLGSALQYLRLVRHFLPSVKGGRLVLFALRRCLTILEQNEVDGDFQSRVHGWIKYFERDYRRGEKLTKKDAESLKKDVEKWTTMLRRELKERPCIEMVKGALNQKALIDTSLGKSSSFFAEEIWLKIPEIARSDFSDAAKCLLVKTSTPAAMIALRGTEAIVREYYTFKTGMTGEKKPLGTIIRELRAQPDANTSLLGYIDYLRSQKRNLAQHPDKIFTESEAERVFMEILNAVHDIYSEM